MFGMVGPHHDRGTRIAPTARPRPTHQDSASHAPFSLLGPRGAFGGPPSRFARAAGRNRRRAHCTRPTPPRRAKSSCPGHGRAPSVLHLPPPNDRLGALTKARRPGGSADRSGMDVHLLAPPRRMRMSTSCPSRVLVRSVRYSRWLPSGDLHWARPPRPRGPTRRCLCIAALPNLAQRLTLASRRFGLGAAMLNRSLAPARYPREKGRRRGHGLRRRHYGRRRRRCFRTRLRQPMLLRTASR